ncbi:hypothetical protein [Kutzneria albida]|uniref:Uncharacterized protein n=1 Tax=Kutzneria albida DSM 43870 TaxID=1449976 RepID=W5WAV3_9PSEU|nr:hypothetical protein [Kutzneria albida]AHH98258.1 hypothetical protein KALB_4896 [Kutzneria albida DSM 43870]
MDTWPDGTPVTIDPNMAPEDATNPQPSVCLRVQWMKDNPAEAVRQTVDSMTSWLTAGSRESAAWWKLSRPSRRALEAIYAGDQPHLHPATRACLQRHGLINDHAVVTLWGRQVVAEMRHSIRIAVEVTCQDCACARRSVWRRKPVCGCRCHNDVIRPEAEHGKAA